MRHQVCQQVVIAVLTLSANGLSDQREKKQADVVGHENWELKVDSNGLRAIPIVKICIILVSAAFFLPPTTEPVLVLRWRSEKCTLCWLKLRVSSHAGDKISETYSQVPNPHQKQRVQSHLPPPPP